MRCYSCGCQLSEHSFCTNCGADVVLYKKIIYTSNQFYNEGLEKAKVRDLSGAILCLRQSLKFNKNNIDARNLLGLVYFEMGEVVAALSEWVISKNLRGKKNIADDYITMIQSNATRLDTINQTIKKYNQALTYCLQQSNDMAIIQLKKVLSMNPKFLRAHQLLALLYLNDGKFDLAKRELTKCTAIDANNTTTLRYLQETENLMNPPEGDKKALKAVASDEVITYTSGNETIIQPIGIKEKKGSNTVLNILVGMAVGFAIAFFLVLPAQVQQEKSAAAEEVKTIGTQLDAKNIKITELEQKVSELNDQMTVMQNSLNAYAGTEGTMLSMENLLKATAIYLNDTTNVLEVADYIAQVDENAWDEKTSEAYKNLYTTLKTAIGSQVSTQYYTEGNKAFRNQQYEDAIAYLTNAVFFDAKNGDALYVLANSYLAAEKKTEAKATYEKILEVFPDTWWSRRATEALAAMSAE